MLVLYSNMLHSIFQVHLSDENKLDIEAELSTPNPTLTTKNTGY